MELCEGRGIVYDERSKVTVNYRGQAKRLTVKVQQYFRQTPYQTSCMIPLTTPTGGIPSFSLGGLKKPVSTSCFKCLTILLVQMVLHLGIQ